MKKRTIIGVDIGGTKICAGRVVDGIVEKSSRYNIPNVSDIDAQAVVDEVKRAIKDVYIDSVEGIGIGVPSVLDRQTGEIYDVQNIKSWDRINLKDILEEEFDIPVYIDNDANCFTLGEKIYGEGKHYNSFVGITIGTGIGGGIINDGSLLDDANCGSGEFGMVPYLDGVLEDYCSGQFFKNKIKQDGFDVFQKALSGNKDAIQAYKDYGKHLGNAIKVIMYTVDPKVIIIGGSIISAKELFEETMWQSINSFAYKISPKKITIKYTDIDGDAQILGASAVYIDRSYQEFMKKA